MTKKRLRIITVLFITLALIVTFAVLFTRVYDNESLEFSNDSSQFSSNIFNEFNNIKYTDESLHDKNELTLNEFVSNQRYPTVFAVFDSEGKAVFKSSPIIGISKFTENSQYDEKELVDLEPFFTEDIQKQIKRFVSHKSYIIESLSVHNDRGNLIPVEAVLGRQNKQGEVTRRINIRFTDYESDFTLTYNKNQLTGYNLGITENIFYDRINRHLNRELNDYISNFTFTDDSESYFGRIFEKENFYQSAELRPVDEAPIVIYTASECSLILTTLTSPDFYRIFSITAIFIIAVGLAVFLIISNLIKKNEELSKSRNAFISGAAHELKTPIAVIANNCECILENIAPEKNSEHMETVYDECRRMKKILNTLLQYNNLNTGAKLKKETADFTALINSVIENYTSLVESKSIRLTAEVPDKLSLKCDKELMEMVIDNFLSNAVKFTPENGEIKINVRKTSGSINFEIFNTGSHISDEDAPHIWEELYSGSKSRSRDENATGMGLAVSRVILELHGFRYGFRNTNDGVVFFFNS